MGWLVVKCVFWGLIVFVQVHGNRGCFEKERLGLLELKAFLSSHMEGLEGRLTHALPLPLPSWVDERNSDCCGWERVTCDSTTGHVTELALYTWKNPRSDFDYSGLINISLFLPFTELTSLDLSQNSFSCCVKNEGFDRLSILKRLEVLNLAYNYDFGNNILQSLGALTSLKNLNLSGTGLDGLFLAPELLSLRNLQVLDLGGNQYNSFLPKQEQDNLSNLEVLILSRNQFYCTLSLPIQELLTFKKLKVLDLSENYFEGNIPPSIGAMSTLKALSLSGNELNGTLPIQAFCELKNLEELDLRHNSIEGSIPLCLERLRSLKFLDLSSNQFTGNIPSSVISSLTSLEYLDLSHNRFEGVFPFKSFSNHSKLKVIQLANHNTELEVETEYSDWVPMFQIEILVLSNCNLNGPKGIIPNFLWSQNELRVVDLSNNNLQGRFPYWLLENNTRLEYLVLRNNSFSGQFHLLANCNTSLYWMDVSNNLFQGELQENIGEMIQFVYHLNLSINAFGGYIPSSFCNMSGIEVMDMSFNDFSGEVPKELIARCMKYISILKLSSNKIHGQVLTTSFNLTNLQALYLDGNHLTDKLSNSNVAPDLHLLQTLDISNNYMSGEFPSWISNYTYLKVFVMKENLFNGQLPCEGYSYLEFLDASHNNLSGSLPSCPILLSIRHMHLQGNRLSGSVPNAFLNSIELVTLDLRDNNLSGSIPRSINALPNLRVLLLRGNHFSGSIPYELCQLNKIGLMDLSSNSFSGSIPLCFDSIAFGRTGVSEHVFQLGNTQTFLGSYHSYGNYLVNKFFWDEPADRTVYELDEVEFVTKSMSRSYKGDILNYMSGLDLSCNNLTGEIPHKLGNLSLIHALNFSYNQLAGSIPESFSNLTQLESLDLSHNSLSGEIPPQLTNLYSLEVFTIAYNNLSGRMPNMKGQFATFGKSNYEGNPFLCGPPLDNNCTGVVESPNFLAADFDEDKGKWYEVDPAAFWPSFGASFIVILLGFATILYVNPYWRRRWFYFIEECIYTCYYFVYDALYKLSSYLSK